MWSEELFTSKGCAIAGTILFCLVAFGVWKIAELSYYAYNKVQIEIKIKDSQ